jgi:hypothetical protein
VLALRLALIVALVFLGYKAARLGWIGWRAYQAARTVLALRADGDIDAADLHQIRDQLHTVEVLAAEGDREVQFIMPLLDAARLLPRIGPTLAAAPYFIATGRELLAAAHAGAGLLADAAGDSGDAPIVPLLVQTMRDQPAAFGTMASHVNTARAVLDVVDADALIAPLVTPVTQSKAALHLAAVALRLAPDLPDLLGFDGPRTYLLLVQNNQELRATGGFISAVGAVTLENGDIAGLNLTDSYAIARNDMDHPWAPDPMRRYMGVELIFLRDANWSPDFPTSAQLARALYAQDAGVKVDGVASIDLHAVQLLVGALGPLEIPGADAPVTGDTILRQIQEFWDKPPATDITAESDYRTWVMQRKDFIPLLAESALARLRQGEYSPLALAAGVDAALVQRGVQVWLAAPGPAQVLAAAGWDGALRPDPAADFLAVVDANMGYNKADAVVERSLDYAIAWPDGPTAPAQATLQITYRHPLNAPSVECTPMSGYAERYSDMVERCYFDYVRVYVPAGSELLSADGFDPGTLTAQPGEQSTHVFGGYFVLPPGQSHTVTLRYTLPPQLVPDSYRLVVQRQSGSGALPFTLTAPDAAHTGLLVDGLLIWQPTAARKSS